MIGVCPPQLKSFAIGAEMNKNLTIKMSNCPQRRYLPLLVRMVRDGEVDTTSVLTRQERLTSAIEEYQSVDQRRPGWLKVELTGAV